MVRCHSDHQGPKLTKRSRKPFSHALLKVSVKDQCSSCHAAPKDTMHRDVKVECSQCHSDKAWKPAHFDHDKYFVLDRDHRPAAFAEPLPPWPYATSDRDVIAGGVPAAWADDIRAFAARHE